MDKSDQSLAVFTVGFALLYLGNIHYAHCWHGIEISGTGKDPNKHHQNHRGDTKHGRGQCALPFGKEGCPEEPADCFPWDVLTGLTSFCTANGTAPCERLHASNIWGYLYRSKLVNHSQESLTECFLS